MSLLSTINASEDIKKLNINQLNQLAEEIRNQMIEVVQHNGGHLSSNLGIVELTLALYYVFDFPVDKLVFDVGHQCYTHKILSGRRDKFSTIRTKGGISGFPDSNESEYDAFSCGHAGTSIAAGLGLCMARDRLLGQEYVINIVGDGSLVNGLNLEALISSQEKPKKYIVVLNDNGMSISKNRNGFYRFISKKTLNEGYIKAKRTLKRVFGNSFITRGLLSVRSFIKRAYNKNNYFENFGFKYFEVAEGNDIKKLIHTLEKVKNKAEEKAVFLHIHTVKGKGFNPAEERAEYYHGVSSENSDGGSSLSKRVGEKLNELIANDNKIVTITAGMKSGTGLERVEKKNPNNFIDVGIAEEYAVTLSAGMAKGGLKPVVCIYSTFLQRAYDEILHDVCIQNLPVVFMLDRAGLTGGDGKTHQGVFDLSYLSHIPNLTILAPSSIEELNQALEYSLKLNSPVAIRYPKDCEDEGENCGDIGRWQIKKEGDKALILAVGPKMNKLALQVSEKVDGVGVINARVIKPLDIEVLNRIKGQKIITLEENSLIGGFGAMINNYFANKSNIVFNLGIKDKFVEHGSIGSQLEDNELTEKDVMVLLD